MWCRPAGHARTADTRRSGGGRRQVPQENRHVLDEIPGAYKDIEQVSGDGSDLVEIEETVAPDGGGQGLTDGRTDGTPGEAFGDKTPKSHGGAVEDRARLVEAVAGRRAGRLAAAALAKGLTLDDVVNHGRREHWPAGAVGRLEAAVALVRAADRDARPPAAFDQPAEIAAFVARRHLPLDVEHFGVLLLSCQNTLLEDHTISIGGTAGAIVDTKRIGRLIMRRATAAVISWHNHPSGVPSPRPRTTKSGSRSTGSPACSAPSPWTTSS